MKAPIPRSVLIIGQATLFSVFATMVPAESSTEIQDILRQYQETIERSPFLQDGTYRFDYTFQGDVAQSVTQYRQGRHWAAEWVTLRETVYTQPYPIFCRAVFEDQALRILESTAFPGNALPEHRRKKEQDTASLYHAQGLYPGVFMDGRTPESFRPIWEAAEADPNVCLEEQFDWIDGMPCRVMHFRVCEKSLDHKVARRAVSRYTLWLDPQLGYQPRRIEMIRNSGYSFFRTSKHQSTYTYHVLRSEQFGNERSYPVDAEATEEITGFWGAKEGESRLYHIRLRRYDVQIKSDTSGYGDIFSIDP